MSLKITFLGTGTSQGIPVINCKCAVCQSKDSLDKRLRVSVCVEIEEYHFVIDTSTDFRYQMLRHRIPKIDAVIFTHAHRDHTAGLDDIRPYNFLQKKAMDCYADKNTRTEIENQFPYIFKDNSYPGIPQIKFHEIPKSPFFIHGIKIIPIEVLHYQLPVLGFRIGDFTYITDASSISDESMKKIEGTKTLVLNALRKEPHISHFTLEQAVDVIKKLNPKQAYLTHISHQLGKHVDVDGDLPRGINLAYDGLQIMVE